MDPKFFATPADWRHWLERHHAHEHELLVGFCTKDSGRPSMKSICGTSVTREPDLSPLVMTETMQLLLRTIFAPKRSANAFPAMLTTAET